MSPDHILTRLRAADPVTWLRDETDAYAPPPRHVMERIVASTPPPPPRGRRRRRLVIAAAAAGLIVAAALGLLQLLPSGKDVDLAAKAYAATAPGDSVVYTERTLERTITPGFESPAPDSQRIEERMWQRGDRVHRISTVLEWGGNRVPRRWNYEYDKRGDVLRILNPNGTVDTIRQGDPGWDPEETRQVLAVEQQTIVERFRTRYARAQLRDAGETVFAGRPAHAYVVVKRAPEAKTGAVPARETFYLDPATGLPLGSINVLSTRSPGKLNPPRLQIPPTGNPDDEQRFTEIVDRYERLPPTPENLAKLDAPAIDAAASEPLSRPRRKGNPKG